MNEADHVAAHELRRRQVDRELQRHRPGSRLAAGFAQDPLAHFNNQAAFFGERNEIGGRYETAQWMLPARQRLKADDRTGGDRRTRGGLRLVVERQFAIPDRHRKILMQHPAVADLLVHLGFEQTDRTARPHLGAEQCRAGIGEQRGRIGAVLREHRDAGGDAGAHRLAVDQEFVRQRLGQLLGERLPGFRLLCRR